MKETWKEIEGYEGSYQVSDMGRIRSLDRRVLDTRNHLQNIKGCIRKLIKPPSGPYYMVSLSKPRREPITVFVHRLVTFAFVSNPQSKPQVNHKDGNPLNNKVVNLEWVSLSENVIHAHRTGLMRQAKGEDHCCAKLKDKDVQEIRIRLQNGEGVCSIAKRFGVSHGTIGAIKKGTAWKGLPSISTVMN